MLKINFDGNSGGVCFNNSDLMDRDGVYYSEGFESKSDVLSLIHLFSLTRDDLRDFYLGYCGSQLDLLCGGCSDLSEVDSAFVESVFRESFDIFNGYLDETALIDFKSDIIFSSIQSFLCKRLNGMKVCGADCVQVMSDVSTSFAVWMQLRFDGFSNESKQYKWFLGEGFLEFGRRSSFSMKSGVFSIKRRGCWFGFDIHNIFIFDDSFSLKALNDYYGGFNNGSISFFNEIAQLILNIRTCGLYDRMLSANSCVDIKDTKDLDSIMYRGFDGDREVDDMITSFGVGHLVLSKAVLGDRLEFYYRALNGDLVSLGSVSPFDSFWCLFRLMNAIGLFHFHDMLFVVKSLKSICSSVVDKDMVHGVFKKLKSDYSTVDFLLFD